MPFNPFFFNDDASASLCCCATAFCVIVRRLCNALKVVVHHPEACSLCGTQAWYLDLDFCVAICRVWPFQFAPDCKRYLTLSRVLYSQLTYQYDLSKPTYCQLIKGDSPRIISRIAFGSVRSISNSVFSPWQYMRRIGSN